MELSALDHFSVTSRSAVDQSMILLLQYQTHPRGFVHYD
jgi:hypothetical protein